MIHNFQIQLSPYQKVATASSYGLLKGHFVLFTPLLENRNIIIKEVAIGRGPRWIAMWLLVGGPDE